VQKSVLHGPASAEQLPRSKYECYCAVYTVDAATFPVGEAQAVSLLTCMLLACSG
jgi:hypothetical protein